MYLDVFGKSKVQNVQVEHEEVEISLHLQENILFFLAKISDMTRNHIILYRKT